MAALLHFRKSRNNYDKRYNNPELGKIKENYIPKPAPQNIEDILKK